METIIKEKAPTPMPEIVTEEPEFELDDIDTKILPPRPRYRKGKHEDEQFNKFVDMINVKYVPPHRRVTKEKPKKEEEPNKKEAKKEIEVVASIATKKIVAPACEDQKDD